MSAKPSDAVTTKYTANKLQSYPQSQHPELRELDARLKNISEKVIPASPYLLTVPNVRPFNLTSHQADDLLRGTPFTAKEEQLQYLSFLADWDDGLITPVGGWDNEKGEIMEQVSVTRSTTTTPKVGAKKISMSDYKKRTAGQSAINGHVKANGNTKSRDLPSVPSTKTSNQNQAGQKRSADVLDKSNFPLEMNKKEELASPLKKARSSPIASVSSQTSQTKGVSKLKLPPPISPTLPPAIEEELARLSNISSTLPELSSTIKTKADIPSNFSKHDKTQASLKSNHSGQKPTSKNNISHFSATTARDFKHISSKHLPEHHIPVLKGSTKNEKAAVAVKDLAVTLDPADHATEALPQKTKYTDKLPGINEPKLSKIVKLKIPRAKRKDLARLLQMKPRPKVDATKSVKQYGKEPIVKSIEGSLSKSERERTRPLPDKSNLGLEAADTRKDAGRSSSGARDIVKPKGKRPRQEDNVQGLVAQSKRQKTLPTMDLQSKPSTPVPPSFRSPVLSHGSTQKLRGSPNPDSRSGASRNEEAVATPQGSVRNGTPVAPNSVERSNRDVRSSSSTTLMGSSSAAPDDVASQSRDQRKYFELGRTLKRESDTLLKLAESQGSPALEKKGLATSVETILCFTLAYSIGDELLRAGHRNSSSSAWNTIFPFINKAKFSSRAHKHMHGLCLLLEAICRNASWTLEYESASSSDYSHSLEKHKALRKQHDEARNLFTKGSQELSVEDLQQSFPETWALNARAPVLYGPPKANSSPFAGDFFFPFTSMTTPVEAVRAGRSVMAEWCRSERVDFTPRLGL